uniref:Uncharacterized protein n=1 Tax=Stomoxys calcitrans TaxID=35570 RepID=A0A1I8NSY7_STOCA
MGKRRKNALVALDSSESESESNIESDLLSLGKKKKRRLSNTQKLSSLSGSSGSESESNTKPKEKTKRSTSSRENIHSEEGIGDLTEKNMEHILNIEEGEVSESGDDSHNEKCSEASNSLSPSSSESSSDSEFDDGYDENLMGDEEDRKRLSCLSEKERETEIFKRIEQRDMMRTRWEIERKLKLARRGEKSLIKKDPKVKKAKKKKDLPEKPIPAVTLISQEEPKSSGNKIDVTPAEKNHAPDAVNGVSEKDTDDEPVNGDYFDHKERSKERKKNVEMNRTDDRRSNAMAMLKARREGKAKRVQGPSGSRSRTKHI